MNVAPSLSNGSASRSEAIIAPGGAYPEVRPFAQVMMSGW
jgi:hypothetical protein